MTRRLLTPNTAALLVLLFLCLEFFSPVLFQDKTFFYRDLPMAAYPMKQFLSTAYHEGFLPFWNPALYCGMPFMATLHPGVFYPPSLIFFLDDFVAALNGYFVLHHLFLTVSVFALCRYWRLSVGAALCSALTAFAGGYFLSLMNLYNHYQSMVWLPAIFLFFQRYLRTAGTGDFLAAVACLTCQTLGGSPENSVMTVGLLGAHSLLVVPAVETRITGALRRTVALGAVVLPALGLSALQLLPTYALIKDSVRNTALLFSDHAKWSLDPITLASLLLPKDFAGFMEWRKPMAVSFLQSVYMGIAPMIFLGLGGLLWKDKAVRFWLGVFVVGIFLALGKYNPLYEPLYHGVPFLGIFRYPEKFYFLSAFGLVFLTGHGIDAAMRRVADATLDLRKVWGVLLGLGALAGLAAGWTDAGGLAMTLGFLLLFGFTWSMFHLKILGPAVLKILLTALILSDLLWRHYMLAPMIDKSFFLQEPRILKKVEAPPGELYRIYSGPITGEIEFGQFVRARNLLLSHIFAKEELRPNMGMIYGMNYANGLPGVELNFIALRYEIFKHSPPAKRRRILERSNVRYQVLSMDLSGHPEGVPESLLTGVEELENALPRAFLVPRARVENYPHVVNLFFDAAFDPRQEVLLMTPPPGNTGASGGTENFSGTVAVVDYRPNRVRLHVRQNAGGFLVLLDSWFPGWQVTVDGAPETVLRADYFYRAVQLPAGEHDVEFYYEPEGFAAGVRVSLGTLLVLAAGAAWREIRRRR